MAAGRPRDHRYLADPQPSEPVPEHDAARAIPRPGLPFEAGELPPREPRVRLVEERGHRTPPRAVRPDSAREHDDPSRRTVFQRGHRGGDGERTPGEAYRHH